MEALYIKLTDIIESFTNFAAQSPIWALIYAAAGAGLACVAYARRYKERLLIPFKFFGFISCWMLFYPAASGAATAYVPLAGFMPIPAAAFIVWCLIKKRPGALVFTALSSFLLLSAAARVWNCVMANNQDILVSPIYTLSRNMIALTNFLRPVPVMGAIRALVLAALGATLAILCFYRIMPGFAPLGSRRAISNYPSLTQREIGYRLFLPGAVMLGASVWHMLHLSKWSPENFFFMLHLMFLGSAAFFTGVASCFVRKSPADKKVGVYALLMAAGLQTLLQVGAFTDVPLPLKDAIYTGMSGIALTSRMGMLTTLLINNTNRYFAETPYSVPIFIGMLALALAVAAAYRFLLKRQSNRCGQAAVDMGIDPDDKQSYLAFNLRSLRPYQLLPPLMFLAWWTQTLGFESTEGRLSAIIEWINYVLGTAAIILLGIVIALTVATAVCGAGQERKLAFENLIMAAVQTAMMAVFDEVVLLAVMTAFVFAAFSYLSKTKLFSNKGLAAALTTIAYEEQARRISQNDSLSDTDKARALGALAAREVMDLRDILKSKDDDD